MRVIEESEAHPGRRVRAEQADSCLGRRSTLGHGCRESANHAAHGVAPRRRLARRPSVAADGHRLAVGSPGRRRDRFALCPAAKLRRCRADRLVVVGGIFGALSLAVLAAVALCSTEITRNLLSDYVAIPLFNGLGPLLGPDWSGGALYTWLTVAAGLTGVVYAVGWLVSVLVSGPLAGTQRCGRAVAEIANRHCPHLAPPRLRPGAGWRSASRSAAASWWSSWCSWS